MPEPIPTENDLSGLHARDGAADTAAEVVRHEEEVEVTRTVVARERFRVRKEIVTEEVQVTVALRREVLHIEPLPADAPGEPAASGQPVAQMQTEDLEVVLHAEVPVVSTEVRPVERVRIRRELVEEPTTVDASRRIEHVAVEQHP